MAVKFIYMFGFIAAFFFSSCSQSPEEIKKELLATDSMQEVYALSNKAQDLGYQGIPIFLDVISENMKTQYRVICYGKLITSMNHLHKMAQEGIYDKKSIPILFHVLEHQISIADSLTTARTLEIITGTNVGYDQDFVNSYTSNDEKTRMQMIAAWKSKVGISE